MSETLRKRLIFVGFIAALVWGYFNFQSDRTKPPHGNVVVADNEQTTATVVGGSAHPINIAAKMKESWGADPFHPITAAPSTTAESSTSLYWQLSGIIYTNQSPVAIINGRPVGVGQTVDNAKVIAIDRDEVTLEANGVRMTLTVTQG